MNSNSDHTTAKPTLVITFKVVLNQHCNETNTSCVSGQKNIGLIETNCLESRVMADTFYPFMVPLRFKTVIRRAPIVATADTGSRHVLCRRIAYDSAPSPQRGQRAKQQDKEYEDY